MLDIGWQELFVIAVVTIVVVGPKDIPRVLRTVTLWVRKIKGMAREFQTSIEDLAREAELDDIKKELEKAKDFDLQRDIEDAIDPTGEFENSVRDLGKTMDTPADRLPGSAQASIVRPKDQGPVESGEPLPDDANKKSAGEPG
jgi:sec-independent protein translocase protein TatB